MPKIGVIHKLATRINKQYCMSLLNLILEPWFTVISALEILLQKNDAA